jgi:hypothetical protein
MSHLARRLCGSVLLLAGGLTCAVGAQMGSAESTTVPGILPTGLGESVDRDIARARAATERFKNADKAVAAGYPRHSDCVANPPQGAMGYHYQNAGLLDTTLDVEKPEVLVYEKMPDGTFKLNGVEYLVPISAWKQPEAPTIMGQKLKRAEQLGIWYLHVWIWEPSPSGVFADWNPRVKC